MKNIEIKEKFKKMLGEVDPDTLIYRRSGTDLEYRKWFETVIEITGGKVVSPGGIQKYCNVSRAAAHKKINNGGVTAFCFHVTKIEKAIFGEKDYICKTPSMFIPIYDLEEWEKELRAKKMDKEREHMPGSKDYNAPFGLLNKKHKVAKGKSITWDSLETR
jgi:hypothetical protein